MNLLETAVSLSISSAARRSGCTPPTIRYYESIGLVAPAPRTAAGRRSYDMADISRLSFIRRARDFGLGIPEVRELLAAAEVPAAACAKARPVVEAHLAVIRAKRAELNALEISLSAMLARCDAGCGPMDDCSVFEQLR